MKKPATYRSTETTRSNVLPSQQLPVQSKQWNHQNKNDVTDVILLSFLLTLNILQTLS